MVGIDFGGDDFCVAGVGELRPAVDAIPAFAKTGAIVEDDLYGEREDEFAFPMEINGGEVLNLRLISGVAEPPLLGVVGDVVDGVVKDLGAVDGLIEEVAEAGVGNGCGGVVRITGGGEGRR